MTATSKPQKIIDPHELVAKAAKVAEGKAAGNEALQHEQIVDLLETFSVARDYKKERAALQRDYPQISEWLWGIDTEMLIDGLENHHALDGIVKELGNQVNERLEGLRWDDLGLSTRYEQLARRAHAEDDWEFIQDRPDPTADPKLPEKKKLRPRFVMPESSYAKLIPGETSFFQKFDLNKKNDLVAWLKELGIEKPDIGVTEEGKGQLVLCAKRNFDVPPKDAALLFDAIALEERAEQLHDDEKWRPVRRAQIPGQKGEDNCFVLPAKAYHGLRGVHEMLGANEQATPEQIAHACQVRLHDRGIAEAKVKALVKVKKVDGKKSVIMTTELARILLDPMHPSDKRCKLSLTKINYNPTADDWDPNNNLLTNQASVLAYRPEKTIRKYLKAWGFEKCTYIDSKQNNPQSEEDAQAFTAYDAQKNTILVSIRGTESFEDAKSDGDVWAENVPKYGPGRVHSGFSEHLDEILGEHEASEDKTVLASIAKYQAEAKAAGQPMPKLMLTGHSLGGAAANLLARYCLKHKIHVDQIYTIGQPKVGTETYVTDFMKDLDKAGTVYFRLVNNNDIVTRITPPFKHRRAGIEVYINHLGKMHEPGASSGLARLMDRLGGISANIRDILSFRGFTIDHINDHFGLVYLGHSRANRDFWFSTKDKNKKALDDGD